MLTKILPGKTNQHLKQSIIIPQTKYIIGEEESASQEKQEIQQENQKESHSILPESASSSSK